VEYWVEIGEGDECAEDSLGEGLSCVLEMFAMFENVGGTGKETSS
jgi:hypothetical protein